MGDLDMGQKYPNFRTGGNHTPYRRCRFPSIVRWCRARLGRSGLARAHFVSHRLILHVPHVSPTPRIRRWTPSTFLTVSCLALPFVWGCDRKKEPPPPPRVQTAPKATPVVPKKEAPWFVGTWMGKARLVVLDDPMTLDRAEWKGQKDKEVPAASEAPNFVELSLSLDIDENRVVSGEGVIEGCEGPLRGLFEGETLRVRFAGQKCSGSLLADRDGDAFSGRAHISVLEGAEDDPAMKPLRGEVELYREGAAR